MTQGKQTLISPWHSVPGYYMEKYPRWDFQENWLNSPPAKNTGQNNQEAAVRRKENSTEDYKTP